MDSKFIKTIFFDIGGVLINIHPEKTLSYLSDCMYMPVDVIKKYFPNEAHNEYEKGNLSDHEWFLAFKDSMPQPCCLKESDFWDAWIQLLGKEKKTINILEALSKDYSIWLLSNTNPSHVQNEIENRYIFPSIVDGAVYSFDMGCRKPEEEIYWKAVDLANTKPIHSIFIDDLDINVDCASRLGFHALHFQSTEKLIKDLRTLKVL